MRPGAPPSAEAFSVRMLKATATATWIAWEWSGRDYDVKMAIQSRHGVDILHMMGAWRLCGCVLAMSTYDADSI
jgi:hypothetical protein